MQEVVVLLEVPEVISSTIRNTCQALQVVVLLQVVLLLLLEELEDISNITSSIRVRLHLNLVRLVLAMEVEASSKFTRTTCRIMQEVVVLLEVPEVISSTIRNTCQALQVVGQLGELEDISNTYRSIQEEVRHLTSQLVFSPQL
jgi:hypothetical protein